MAETVSRVHGNFWILGFVFGLIYLTTLLGVGMPYLLFNRRL